MSGARAGGNGKVAAIGAVSILLAGFAAGLSGVPLPTLPLRAAAGGTGRYVPAASVRPGAELALIFIGASSCGPSNAPELPRQVEALKLGIANRARAGGRSFAAIGIARDARAATGIEHLRRFGAFDEVVAGRGWLNTGLLRYVWEDLPGRAATPQVLVVERRVFDRATPQAADGLVRGERLLVRKVGLTEIERWLRAGAPLPELAPAPDR